MEVFTIGRHKSNDFVIEDNSVSGKHAEIEITDDYQTWILKDLDSTNGTNVNDRNVITKELSNKDKISFGNAKIDNKELFKNIKAFILNTRQDFQEEFEILKKVEDTYTNKKIRINKYYRLRTMLPRILITLAVVLIISFLKIDNEIRYMIMVGASLLGGALSTLSVSERKKLEVLEDLRVNFQLNFTCPKCAKELYNNKWRYWKEKKTCPNCKCNWT